MKFKIVGRPEFYFALTKEQIEILCSLSKSHYDFESRSLSKPGGAIFSWNFRLNEEQTVDVSATWRQLDSVSKVLEMTGHLTPEKQERAEKLAVDISKMLITARDEICPTWDFTADTDVKGE